MAHDIINIVTILGNSFDVQEVMSVLINKNKHVTFDGFIPMPSDIKATTSPIDNDMKLDLLDKYGVDNWREWSKLYWGTAEKPSQTEIIKENKVKFRTDNNCPFEAFTTLSKIFPTVKIKLQFSDEDLGFHVGEIFYKDGIIIDSKVPKSGSDEAYKMSIEITDDKYYITDFLYGIEEYEMKQEFVSMCVKLAFDFRVLDEKFPSFIHKKFEQWAVDEEDYEFANDIHSLVKD